MMKELVSSATHRRASSRLSLLSIRHSFANSIAARARFPYCSCLLSNNSNNVKASAVPPANPAITFPEAKVLTFLALLFIMVLPILTWPSPAIATFPLRRTEIIVVPRY